jgi:glycosyltransferase involved in cell wall biosynthesis
LISKPKRATWRGTEFRGEPVIARVLLVFEFATLNGGERSMQAVLPQFVGTEFEFVALVPSSGPLAKSFDAIGVPTVPFDVRDGGGQRRPTEQILHDLQTAIRRVRPDIIHGNSLSMGRITGILASQTTTICTAHLRDIMGLSAAAVSQLNTNRALVAVSHAVRDFHVAQGVERSRMHVIYNGVDSEALPPKSSNGSLRAELQLPSDAFLVATIGQICLRKGQDVFARAAILAAQLMPAAHFLLIGERYSVKPESIAYDEAIDREIAGAGLSDRFHRLGRRNDIERLLPELDLLVHGARQEPFGRVLLEAAAAGCPIIATAVGGTAEMLVDGQSALLVPADQPERLARSMIHAHADAELRRDLAREAKRRIARYFSIETAARRLADFWRNALNE